MANQSAPQVPRQSVSDSRRTKRRSVPSMIIGGFGEILITAGLVVGLFVVWNVWITNLLVDKDQAAALADFDAQSLRIPGKYAPKYKMPAPVDPVPGYHESWGAMWIPRFDRNYRIVVAEGTDTRGVLDKGHAGHYPGDPKVAKEHNQIPSNMPGAPGNAAFSAHRDVYGGEFKHADQLTSGDEIIVESKKYWYVYKVYENKVVWPTQAEVAWPVPGNAGAVPKDALITLTTCTPNWTAYQRIAVHGKLEYWSKKSEGWPEALKNADVVKQAVSAQPPGGKPLPAPEGVGDEGAQ